MLIIKHLDFVFLFSFLIFFNKKTGSKKNTKTQNIDYQLNPKNDKKCISSINAIKNANQRYFKKIKQ